MMSPSQVIYDWLSAGFNKPFDAPSTLFGDICPRLSFMPIESPFKGCYRVTGEIWVDLGDYFVCISEVNVAGNCPKWTKTIEFADPQFFERLFESFRQTGLDKYWKNPAEIPVLN
jgi:hypothetical protein